MPTTTGPWPRAAAQDGEGSRALRLELARGGRRVRQRGAPAPHPQAPAKERGRGGEGRAGFATLADAVVALQSLGGSEPPPPQERTKRWLLSQRSALDAICESVSAARLVHKTVSAAGSPRRASSPAAGRRRRRRRRSPPSARASTARDRLDAFLVPAMESVEGDDDDADVGDGSWSAPPLVAADVAKALAGNFDELRAASAKIEAAYAASIDAVRSAPAVIEGSRAAPRVGAARRCSSTRFDARTRSRKGPHPPAKSKSSAPRRERAPGGGGWRKLAAAAEVTSRVAEASARLSESVEAATSAALVWAQHVKAAADGPPSAKRENGGRRRRRRRGGGRRAAHDDPHRGSPLRSDGHEAPGKTPVSPRRRLRGPSRTSRTPR